jgi:hypothetical protein
MSVPALARLSRGSVRNVDFAALHEAFLVSAVVTILIIRTDLWLTHYPQLGGHGLHIAHLLWGGLLMVISIGTLLTFVGRGIRHTAAVVGGIGFGFFLDELGKFITADNDYFFRPALALIYVIFVALFLFTRMLAGHHRFEPREYLANALELVAESVRRPLDAYERRRALELLDRADPADPLVAETRRIVSRLPEGPPARIGLLTRVTAPLRDGCAEIAERRAWPTVLIVAFLAWAILSLVQVWVLVLGFGLHLGHAQPGFRSDSLGDLHAVNVISLVSSVVSLVFVAVGVERLRRGDRLGAYRTFERALLVAIFVTRVFSFVESQLHAVFGLGIDLALLIALRSLTARQREADGRP